MNVTKEEALKILNNRKVYVENFKNSELIKCKLDSLGFISCIYHNQNPPYLELYCDGAGNWKYNGIIDLEEFEELSFNPITAKEIIDLQIIKEYKFKVGEYVRDTEYNIKSKISECIDGGYRLEGWSRLISEDKLEYLNPSKFGIGEKVYHIYHQYPLKISSINFSSANGTYMYDLFDGVKSIGVFPEEEIRELTYDSEIEKPVYKVGDQVVTNKNRRGTITKITAKYFYRLDGGADYDSSEIHLISTRMKAGQLKKALENVSDESWVMINGEPAMSAQDDTLGNFYIDSVPLKKFLIGDKVLVGYTGICGEIVGITNSGYEVKHGSLTGTYKEQELERYDTGNSTNTGLPEQTF